jgi:hypothetical protein
MPAVQQGALHTDELRVTQTIAWKMADSLVIGQKRRRSRSRRAVTLLWDRRDPGDILVRGLR